jgi:hypothetical protein
MEKEAIFEKIIFENGEGFIIALGELLVDKSTSFLVQRI